MSNNNEVKAITITCLLEFHSDNYDEGEGNVKTLKKIRRSMGVFTFRSRYKNRYNLFQTLKNFGWKEAPVTLSGSGDNKVIQFDLKKANIITHEELDAFGYMFTEGSTTLTRKAPVGITRAEALEPYYGDYAFCANHDLVRRAREQGEDANPNISNPEEAKSVYKLTVTIDCERLGKDEWILDLIDDYEFVIHFLNNIRDNLGNTDFTKKVKEFIEYIFDKNFKWKEYKDEKKKVSKELCEKIDGSNSDVDVVMILEILEKVLHDSKIIKDKKEKNRKEVEKEVLNKAHKKLKDILASLEKSPFKQSKGGIKFNELANNKLKIIFEVCSEEKKKRIKDIIKAVINGLSDNTTPLSPIFVVGAGLKVPMPLFHSHIHVIYIDQNKFEVVGIEDALNDYIVGSIFIKGSNRAYTQYNGEYISNEEDFINNLLGACCSAGREKDLCQKSNEQQSDES